MTIRQKLLASFVLLVALAGGLGFLGLQSVTRVGELTTLLYDGPLTGISFARSAQNRFSEAYRHMMKAVDLSQEFGSEADRAMIDQTFEELIADLDVVAERLPQEDVQQQVATIKEAAAAWKGEGDKLLAGSGDGAAITAVPPSSVLEQQAEAIAYEISILVEQAAAAGFMFRAEAEEVVGQTLKTNMIALGVFAAVGIGLAVVLSTSLVRRIRVAMGTARRVADGDLDGEIEVKGRDECAQLLAALEEMQEKLRERREKDQLDAREKERAEAEIERRRKELEETFEREVGNTLRPVADSIAAMGEMTKRMAELARSTDEQAGTVASSTQEASQNVSTVAAAAEELTASITEIGRRVEDATKIARGAVDETERTNETVSGLADAAQKIGDILGLIQNIAEQTNLLALNATIEAARAGEAGKGFAVVANEVKSLANQTAKATDEIAEQINNMRSVTDAAASAIKHIGEIIVDVNDHASTIATAVEQQNAATSEIAQNVSAAASGTSRISGTIGQVSEATAETGRMANDLAGLSNDLAAHSDNLRRSVEGFLTQIRAA